MLYSSNNDCVSRKAALQMSHGRQINAAMKLGQPRDCPATNSGGQWPQAYARCIGKGHVSAGVSQICYVAVTEWPGPVPSEPKPDCRQAGLQLQPAIRIRAGLLPCSKIIKKMCCLDQCT